ncbi:MAG: heat-inducible transcription repressor HrcA [Firmicutes bacterium]|nr:heat-inducible transcription repressor HrcA [Bacillota bacterium]
MITTRQSQLLKLIVEDYIKTAKPISSKSLCKQLNCSSATIRNEMGYLEEIGLLEKTHTSSGRIPSEKGYRYYVDHIMEPKELSGDDMLKLQQIFKNHSLVLSDAIKESMEIISELTNYTAIVLGKSSKENRVSKVEVVPLEPTKLLAIVITDKGHVEHRNMILPEQIQTEEVKKTVELINKLIIGTPIDEVSSKLEFEVKPIIGKYVSQHEALYNAFYNAFADFAQESKMQMAGTSKIISLPEFSSDAGKIQDIISKFEDRDFVSRIEKTTDDENDINIYIGSENEFDQNVTIVKTNYETDDGEEGTIALIGPKRMEYDRVIGLLDFIKKNIGE